MQTGRWTAYAGSRLKLPIIREGTARKPAFQPYWGKPAVRNEWGDRGNVGIIRSPVRASILPDRQRSNRVAPPSRNLRWANSEGRQADRSAGSAGNKDPTSHQHEDGRGA